MILSKNTYPETRKCVSGYFSGSFAHTTPKRSENYGRKQAGAVELPFAPAAGDHGLGQCGREKGEPGAPGPLLRQNQPGYLFRSKDLGAGGEGHAGAEVEDDEGINHYKAFLITCANASQYGNNAYIAPQANMHDGLMDVVIMEPFDILEAPQIAIDMFGKTLDKSSRIKTFRTKRLHIHRAKEGPIHYDGEPVMTGADIDVHVEHEGIKIVINGEGDKSSRQPNALQTVACEMFNDLNTIRDDISKQTHRGKILTKIIQKRIEDSLPNL